MIAFALALVFCVLFVEMFFFSKLIADIRSMLTTSKSSLTVLASSQLSDDEKEKLTRRNAIELMKSTSLFIGKLLGIIVLLYLLFYVIQLLAPELASALESDFQTPSVLLALTVISIGYVYLRNVVVRRI